MFKLMDKNDPILWPVSVSVPVAKGKVERHKFNIEFLMMDDQEAQEVIESDGEVEFLRRVVVGWDESVADEDGQPLPFGSEPLNLLLKRTYVRLGLITAYGQMSRGIAEKNFKMPQKAGRHRS